MATCDELIKGAFRRAGVSRDIEEVRPRELDRGLQVLQDLYLRMVASGGFGRFRDVSVTADYEAEEQDRILVTTTDAVTITIPETIDDPDADDGVRPPLDGSVIAITDAESTLRRTYIYDAGYAAWTLIEDLTLTAYAPLSVRYRHALESKMAVLLAGENGMPVTAELRRQEGLGNLAFVQRFDAPERASSPTTFF